MNGSAQLSRLIAGVVCIAMMTAFFSIASPLATAQGTITQVAPTAGTTTADAASVFREQLTVSGATGAVTFVTATSNSGLTVSATGLISTTGTLPAGTYPVSGTDSDTSGDSGTWTFTLTVTSSIAATEIVQTSPTTGTVSATESGTFSDQLTVSGATGAVTFVTATSNSGLTVSATGLISTTGTLPAGTYPVSGTDSDTSGDSGTWTFTLTVTSSTTTIIQTSSTTGTVSATASGTFTAGPITVEGNTGPVTFVTTVPNSGLTVSARGRISTTGTLSRGTYSVSGTDSDTHGDSGTWAFTLTVTSSTTTIVQTSPTTGTVPATASGTFSDQLAVSGATGAVTFVTTVPNSGLTVSARGLISTTGTLSRGTYLVSGTDSDTHGDTGTWTFTLTVTSSTTTIVQTSPTTGTVSATASASFIAGPITVEGNTGPVTFVTTTPSPRVRVSATGLISTTGTLSRGTYPVSGTDSDTHGDSGTWTFTLTVIAKTSAAIVTFSANRGTGRMAPERASRPTPLSLNRFVRAGYTFFYWTTAANGSGARYANGAVFPFTKSTKLFAQWKRARVSSHAIIFRPNGGRGSTPAEIASTPTPIRANQFTRAGYTFVDWNTAANGRGERFLPGSTYSFKRSIILYAEWKKVAAALRVVTFTANGGRGAMATEDHRAPTTLTPDGFTRAGYTFVGWNTAANGTGTPYANGATYSFAASTTLYAQWKKNKEIVTPTPISYPSGMKIGPFGLKDSTLSPALESQIRQLAEVVKTKRDTQIALLGYGDKLSATTEDNKTLVATNAALGRARAEAVATYLEVRLNLLGFTGWTISITATGLSAEGIVIASPT